MKLYSKLLDFLAHGAKDAAKAVYRRPVIALSGAWRQALFNTRFIGVTGSAGKTTTKELLYAALASRYRCVKNTDTNNQLYSIARTLVSTGLRTQFCVQEIGASERGGFDPMLALFEPHVGVVTNVGTDHFTSFRTREEVAAEKSKLIACLPADGIAVLNADDDLVAAMAAGCRARVVYYSLQQNAEFRGELVNHDWPQRLTMKVHRGGETVLVQTRLLGKHQAHNVLAAIATACVLGVPLRDAAAAVSLENPISGRMSVHATSNGVTFIRDDFKAPFWSLPFVFEFMASAQAPRKLIVLGTVSDYGGERSRSYRRMVTDAMNAADHVALIGSRGVSAASRLGSVGERLHAFETSREASNWLSGFVQAGDLVLMKGSNLDHLARLALAFDGEVHCWRQRCERNLFCGHCRLLGESAPP